MTVVDPSRQRHLGGSGSSRRAGGKPPTTGRRSAPRAGSGRGSQTGSRTGARTGGAPATVGAVRRIRPRRSFLRVPLAAVVGVEAIVAAWFVAAGGSGPAALVAAAAVAVCGLLFLLTAGGATPVATAFRRAAFVTRGKVATARPDPDATAPAALRAVFPGLVLRSAQDRRGRPFAVAEWAGTATVVLAVRRPDGPLVRARASARLPLEAIHDEVAATGIPVEALTVTTVLPGPSKQATTSSSGAARPVARRIDLVSLRVRPFDARTAITVRGGGRVGLDATLAALAAVVRVTVAEAGLTAEPLDVAAAADALTSVLEPGHPPASPGSTADSVATWAEAWGEVAGPGTVSTSVAAISWDPSAALDPTAPSGPAGAASGDEVPDRVLSTVLVPTAEGPAVVRIVLRAAAAPGTSVRRMRRTATEAGQATGLRCRATAGEQLAALRAGTPLGAGVVLPDPRDAPGSSVLAQGLSVPPHVMDRLAPPLAGGIPFGTAESGVPLDLDLVGTRPLRVVAVGQGWIANELAARAAAAGLPVVVVTDRPAPWLAMARAASSSDRVTVVADERSVDYAPAGGSGVVVVDGTGTTPATAGQRRWRTTVLATLRADAVPPEYTAAADLVLVAPDADDDPQRLAAVLHVPGDVGARAVRLTGTEFLAVSRGAVVTGRLHP